MYLYYDKLSEMFTLETEDDVKFLGPLKHAIVALKKNFDFTLSQAREAVLQAFFNDGFGIDLNQLTRYAQLIERKS